MVGNENGRLSGLKAVYRQAVEKEKLHSEGEYLACLLGSAEAKDFILREEERETLPSPPAPLPAAEESARTETPGPIETSVPLAPSVEIGAMHQVPGRGEAAPVPAEAKDKETAVLLAHHDTWTKAWAELEASLKSGEESFRSESLAACETLLDQPEAQVFFSERGDRIRDIIAEQIGGLEKKAAHRELEEKEADFLLDVLTLFPSPYSYSPLLGKDEAGLYLLYLRLQELRKKVESENIAASAEGNGGAEDFEVLGREP